MAKLVIVHPDGTWMVANEWVQVRVCDSGVVAEAEQRGGVPEGNRLKELEQNIAWISKSMELE